MTDRDKAAYKQLSKIDRERRTKKTQILLRLKLNLLEHHESFSQRRRGKKKNQRNKKRMEKHLRKISEIQNTPRIRGSSQMQCKSVSSLFSKKIKNGHKWVSVLAKHRRDPYSATWRANVLHQSLLMILCINGMFYGVDQSETEEIVIAVYSAFIVATLDVLTILTAKRIGTYKWKRRMCELRQRLCRRIKGKKRNNMFGRKEGKSEIEVLRVKEGIASFAAWGVFLVISLGCSFAILVLGVKFDLDDDNDGRNYEIHRSTSFKWMLSCIICESLLSVVTMPIIFAVQALVIYGAIVCIPNLAQDAAVNWFISDDDLEELRAYDVFEKINRDFTLNDDGIARLQRIASTKSGLPLEFLIDQEKEKEQGDRKSNSTLEKLTAQKLNGTAKSQFPKNDTENGGKTENVKIEDRDSKWRPNPIGHHFKH